MKLGKKEGKRYFHDLALIGFFLLAAVVLFAVIHARQADGAVVVVRVNGEETGRYSLDTDGRYVLNGGTNTLVIEAGAAYLTDADCPDKLCVRQGRIRAAGQVITCLPNRLTVTVYGADHGVDIVI